MVVPVFLERRYKEGHFTDEQDFLVRGKKELTDKLETSSQSNMENNVSEKASPLSTFMASPASRIVILSEALTYHAIAARQ